MIPQNIGIIPPIINTIGFISKWIGTNKVRIKGMENIIRPIKINGNKIEE